MTRIAAIAAVLGLVLTSGLSQEMRMRTRPKPPAREVLERLSLTQAWRAHIKTDGLRDGLLSVQVIPGATPKDQPQVIVQTYSGLVVLLDGETGDPLWRATVGEPYWPGQPAAYNSSSIIVTRREFLYVLNRADGAHRVFVLDKATRQPIHGMSMLAGASAAPVADEDAVYIPMHNRVIAYDLPINGSERAAELEAPAEAPEGAILPIFRWSYVTAAQTYLQPPLESASQVSFVGTDGLLTSVNKYERTFRFEQAFQGAVTAGMAQHGDIAYVPCEDTVVYALNMVNGRVLWRYFSGGPLRQKAEATDRDIFAHPERIGLVRLDRASGREVWTNKIAQRFLATNFKYLYAADRIGQLLVLDYHRGTTLAKYDTSEWIVPVTNDLTDRIYFANHDGQVLCLRHRDERAPVLVKTPPKEEEEPTQEKPILEKEPEKDEKKPIDEKEKEKNKMAARDLPGALPACVGVGQAKTQIVADYRRWALGNPTNRRPFAYINP